MGRFDFAKPLPDTQSIACRWTPGHHYSPIPSLEEIAREEDRIFGDCPTELPGINLNTEHQLAMLRTLTPLYASQPFRYERVPGLRYCFADGQSFSYADALSLHAMLRHLRPRTVVEVGSGWSSCVMLDTVAGFGLETRTHHIDPYIDTMKEIPFHFDDAGFANVRSERLQDTPLSLFTELAAGDILFIDSSHVCKTGSDVEHLFGEILPRLASGVTVHFHDIFYPFEYPKEWVYEGRAWNEAYVLRSFLQFNAAFSIELFHSYLVHLHTKAFFDACPLAIHNCGGSIWLRRA